MAAIISNSWNRERSVILNPEQLPQSTFWNISLLLLVYLSLWYVNIRVQYIGYLKGITQLFYNTDDSSVLISWENKDTVIFSNEAACGRMELPSDSKILFNIRLSRQWNARETMLVWGNFEALSGNHCYSGKEISITYSECVCVSLFLP